MAWAQVIIPDSCTTFSLTTDRCSGEACSYLPTFPCVHYDSFYGNKATTKKTFLDISTIIGN